MGCACIQSEVVIRSSRVEKQRLSVNERPVNRGSDARTVARPSNVRSEVLSNNNNPNPQPVVPRGSNTRNNVQNQNYQRNIELLMQLNNNPNHNFEPYLQSKNDPDFNFEELGKF